MNSVLYYLKYLNEDGLLKNLIERNLKYAFDSNFLKNFPDITIKEFYNQCIEDAKSHLQYLKSFEEQTVENPGFVFGCEYYYDNNEEENSKLKKYKMCNLGVIYLEDYKRDGEEVIYKTIDDEKIENIVNFLIPKPSYKDLWEIVDFIIFTTWKMRKSDFFQKINNGIKFKEISSIIKPVDKSIGLDEVPLPKSHLISKYSSITTELGTVFLDKIIDNSYRETIWEIKDKFCY